MYTIRPFDSSDADYAALVEIWNAILPDQPTSVQFEQRTDRQRQPEYLFQRVAAESNNSGQVIGVANYGHMPFAHHPRRFSIRVAVHPNFQRRGIGTALYDHCVAALKPHDPIAFEGGTREDILGGVKFLTRRGYKLGSRIPTSELNPAQFDPDRFAVTLDQVTRSGIVLKTFGELSQTDPDVLKKLHELSVAVERDIPWHHDFTPQPFAAWKLGYIDNPDLLPDAYIIALDGGRYVGLSQIWASQATDVILYTGLTGVRRSHRRRGIATAMKVKAITRAKQIRTAAGTVPVIRTDNEETNPMFQLNLALGFKERPAWVDYVKKLRP